MDLELLYKRFKVRWKNLEKKSLQEGLKLPDKSLLWREVLQSYEKGFRCEYCNVEMLIRDSEYPHYKSFSLDHRTSIDLGGDNSIQNFAIVCHRCNMIKGTMTERTFRELLEAIDKRPGLADRVFREIWSGRVANKLEREEKRKVSR